MKVPRRTSFIAAVTEMQQERGWSNTQLIWVLARLIAQVAEEDDDQRARKDDDRA